MTVVDLGDRVVVRPAPDEPVKVLRGKYKGVGPATEEARRQERDEEAARAPAHGRP